LALTNAEKMMTRLEIENNPAQILPQDAEDALLIGRAWGGGKNGGPSPVLVRGNELCDLVGLAPTVAHLLLLENLAEKLREGDWPVLGILEEAMAGNPGQSEKLHLLAPCDLQAIKACGVTFASSLLERVIEEAAAGDAAAAVSIRTDLKARIGTDLSKIVPGSDTAMALKAELEREGLWSQYMEVGLGPDAEVFTKAQPMSAVGFGADVGIHPQSSWSNPEPEVVLVVTATGRVAGATLGNDVNLRDVEGRSALLLGKAKDNNASCAIGPFIRLFDNEFGIEDIRKAEISLKVEGLDGFLLEGGSNMKEISRDPIDLVSHAAGENHQYPDGFLLFTGTLFAPIKDRDAPGMGFTHHIGDRVSIYSSKLGLLQNRTNTSDKAPPWTFGSTQLFDNLSRRGVLNR
jgi:fumarylacetoacetate (FAA) hydrolase family protein